MGVARPRDTQAAAVTDPLAEGLDGFAPYLMNRVIGRYNDSLRQEMARLGLTTPQMRTLAVLSEKGGLLIRDLAVYTVTEQSTLSRALSQLVSAGLVRREADPRDSRAVQVHLTDAGRSAYRLLWPHMAEGVTRMFHGIDADEQHAFVATLQKMLRNVRRNEI